MHICSSPDLVTVMNLRNMKMAVGKPGYKANWTAPSSLLIQNSFYRGICHPTVRRPRTRTNFGAMSDARVMVFSGGGPPFTLPMINKESPEGTAFTVPLSHVVAISVTISVQEGCGRTTGPSKATLCPPACLYSGRERETEPEA